MADAGPTANTVGITAKPLLSGSKAFIALAVSAGAGTVLGLVGAYLYYKFHKRLCSDCAALRNDLMVIRNELERLREYVQRLGNKKSSVHRRRAKSSISDDIFFDAIDNSSEEEILVAEEAGGVASSSSDETASKKSSASGRSSPVSQIEILFKTIDQLVADSTDEKRQRAYQLMQQNYESGKNDAEFMWRYAMTAYLYAQTFQGRDEKRRKSLFYEAKDRAFAALLINDQSGSVHKWCALTVGVLADFVGVREKVDFGHKFKVHIDRALELSPMDAVLHHLCGRWCFSVASLSWLERKVVSALFSNAPSSTFEDALKEFLEADRLNPHWLENILYVAKCYQATKDYDQCRQRIRRSQRIKAVSSDDFASQKAMQAILDKI